MQTVLLQVTNITFKDNVGNGAVFSSCLFFFIVSCNYGRTQPMPLVALDIARLCFLVYSRDGNSSGNMLYVVPMLIVVVAVAAAAVVAVVTVVEHWQQQVLWQ